MGKIRYNAPFELRVDGVPYQSMKRRLTAADIRSLVSAPEDAEVLVTSPTGVVHAMDREEELSMLRIHSEWETVSIKRKKKLPSLKRYKGRFNGTGYPKLNDLRDYLKQPELTGRQRDQLWNDYKTKKPSRRNR